MFVIIFRENKRKFILSDGCIVSAQSVSLSIPDCMLGSVGINNFSAINMSWGATNHATIKTLIYCCPAPGDLTELRASKPRIKPSLLPLVSGHRWSPDVRWNCVNSQLYRQLQRLSHPGPPSRVTICIGSDHPGHQLAIVPDITTHMVTKSVWEHQEKQIERRSSPF